MTQSPAGWYPSPDGRHRWWDGSVWTEHYYPPQQIALVAPPRQKVPLKTKVWIGVGCVLALPFWALVDGILRAYGVDY